MAERVGIERVKHCPGCGGTVLDHGAAIVQENPDNPVFDVLCRSCGWSGDISPDLPLGVDAR